MINRTHNFWRLLQPGSLLHERDAVPFRTLCLVEQVSVNSHPARAIRPLPKETTGTLFRKINSKILKPLQKDQKKRDPENTKKMQR